MLRYVLRRLVLVIPTLVGILTLVFILLQAIPGDPAIALVGDKASDEQIERIREEYGLNRPLPVQYAYFVKSALTLDFGRSLRTHQPVWKELHQFFGATIELSVAALLIALSIGIPLGVIAATRRNTVADYGAMVVALLGISMPVYWAGIVLIYLLSFRLGLFPIAGIMDSHIDLRHITYGYVTDSILTGNWAAFRSSLYHLLLPAFVLSTIPMAIIARMARSSMLEVLGQEYLRTARAKGLVERAVIVRHALKNALIPVVTVIGLQFGGLLSGAFLTETVFARPGVGRYVVTAIGARDYPVIQATVLLVAVLFVLINLLVDLVYAFLSIPGFTLDEGTTVIRDEQLSRHDSAPAATTATELAGTLERVGRGPTGLWVDAARRMRGDKAAVAGLVVIALLALVAVFAPLLAPDSPTDQSFINKLQGPSRAHLLGTDEFGRDTLSRVIYGSRVALRVGLLPVAIALLFGVTAGLASGYYGGPTDQVLMRFADILLAFPWLLLAIGIVAILGPGINNVIIAVAIIYVPVFARIVRASVLSIKEREYVEAARAIGQPDAQIIVRHILRNAWAPIIVQATLAIGQAIIYAAGLSFIGLGTQPPDADWGVMLKSGHEFLRDSPWMGIFPGLAILVTVLAFNLFGDGLRDALDPRIR